MTKETLKKKERRGKVQFNETSLQRAYFLEYDVKESIKRLKKYAELTNDEPLKSTIIEIFGNI